MIKTEQLIYDTRGAVLKANTIGFYKIKGLAAKSGRCRHISCGATKPMTCHYWRELEDHLEKVKTGVWYGNQPYTAQMQSSQQIRLDNMKTYHPTCTNDWCARQIGKPRPPDLGEMVACSRHHLTPYTEAELAQPDVKPESIAVEMYIAMLGTDRGIDLAIGLYDLIDDKWFNDKWWTMVGWKNNNLMPHDKKDYPAPKELVNIDQVIAAVKAKL